MAAYLSLLDPAALLRACPGGIAQGLIWGVMALGVYFTFRILDLADLTVDGSFATGGAVCIMLIAGGMNPELALVICTLTGAAAGVITGLLHTKLGIPAILAGILTQISLYSINLNIMGKANQAINAGAVKLRITSNAMFLGRTIGLTAFCGLILIVILYCYLGTENGCAFRATGNNAAMSRASTMSGVISAIPSAYSEEYKNITVNRRRYKYALAHVVRALENGAVGKIAVGLLETEQE